MNKEIPFATVFDSPEDCTNAGPCCLTCPHYDACDHHYEEQESLT